MQTQPGGSARNTKRTAEPGDEVINVLLIEDDPAVREMYRLRLELDGSVELRGSLCQVAGAKIRASQGIVFPGRPRR